MGLNKATFAKSLILASLIGATVDPARAAYVVTLEQEGANVVAAGSGAIDFTDLSFDGSSGVSPSSGILAIAGLINIGVSHGIDIYTGFTGPTSFGPGQGIDANSSSGDFVAIQAEFQQLVVPPGYVSGSPLSSTSTWDDTTLSELGVTPGTYKWTWGSGANADSFTLDIKAIPEPSTWAMMLIGFAGLGFAGYRASRRTAAAA
jgi:hypothetical protein